MNINKWSTNKKILAVLGVLLVIAGIALTIFIVQQRQNTRTQAEKSTTLSLAPSTQNATPGGNANLDINIDPGVNQVNLIKITLKFDAERFSTTANDFTLDPASELEIINGPVVGAGSFAVVVSVDNNPTKVIRSPQKIGSLVLKVADDAPVGASEVAFEIEQTEVRSIEAGDAFTENVLSVTVPASINVEGVCRPDISTCSWDPLVGASSYKYKVVKVTPNGETVVVEDTTTETSVEFESEVGQSYRCEVSAVNACGGVGAVEKTTNICTIPSGTPTPTLPVTTSTPTPTRANTPTPTVPRSTSTPTPTPTLVINSPTPTTPGITVEPTPTTEVFATETPAPTLPPTGSPMFLGGLIGGFLIIIGGALLLFL